MKTIKIKEIAGTFAENKDKAQEIRLQNIVPHVEKGEEVVLDFLDVEDATQSFIHALIADLIRKYGPEVLEKISFKHCNETIRKIITLVTDYMQESIS